MNKNFCALLQEFPPSGRGVSFGYPELVTRDHARRVTRSRSEEFFEELGVSVDVFDVKCLFGMELPLDLNVPLPGRLLQAYDFLINPGTYEHCFNIGQAVVNGYYILVPGGISYHTGPVARHEHGFWNYTVNTFRRFYEHNGGEILHQSIADRGVFIVARNGSKSRRVTFPMEKR